jgi:hypothetical protein
MDGAFGRTSVNLAALRAGTMAPTRGIHIASLGADLLERILHERDELRESSARASACAPCRCGDHNGCDLALYNEAAHNGGDAIGPYGLGTAPRCTCSDCRLGIPAAAAETWLPAEVQAELVRPQGVGPLCDLVIREPFSSSKHCARRTGHLKAGERRIEANEILGTGGCVADPARAAYLDKVELERAR